MLASVSPLKELFALTELCRSLKSETDEVIYKRMADLAREIGTLEPGESRRAYIVSEILRLSGLILTWSVE